jgi:hypothetical protein
VIIINLNFKIWRKRKKRGKWPKLESWTVRPCNLNWSLVKDLSQYLRVYSKALARIDSISQLRLDRTKRFENNAVQWKCQNEMQWLIGFGSENSGRWEHLELLWLKLNRRKQRNGGGVVFVFAAKVRAGRMCGGGKTHVWFVFFWINKRNGIMKLDLMGR